MLKKVLKVISILLLFTGIIGTIYFGNIVKENSLNVTIRVLAAKVDIPEGTVIKNAEEANKMFFAKKVRVSDLVKNVVRIETVESTDATLVQKVRGILFPNSSETITQQTLNALVNRVVQIPIKENQQILAEYIKKDGAGEFGSDEKEIAIPIDYFESDGGEIKKDEYVQIWILYNDKHPEKPSKSEKLFDEIRVVKIKDGNNEEVNPGEKKMPRVAIFRFKDEKDIEYIKNRQKEGSFFLVRINK